MLNVKNNSILCLISSVLSLIIVYLSNKGDDNKISYMAYFKQFLGMFGATFLVLFLKDTLLSKVDMGESSKLVKGGYQEHVSLGDPGF